METEWTPGRPDDDDDFEESCDHGKWDDEECPECDAYFAAHPDEVEDDDGGTDDDGDDEGGELVEA